MPTWDGHCHAHRRAVHQPSGGETAGGSVPARGGFHGRKVSKPQYQDKDGVKQLVSQWLKDSGEELAIAATFHVIRDADTIMLAMIERLPKNFVFKGTHGSGMVMMVTGTCTRSPHAHAASPFVMALSVGEREDSTRGAFPLAWRHHWTIKRAHRRRYSTVRAGCLWQ